MGLIFFARKPFLHKKDHHLMAGSSIIRAEQIAEYLGAKLNPTSWHENDICIYIKPSILSDSDFCNNVKNKIYLDLVDDGKYIDLIRKYPKKFGIAISQYSYEILKDEMPNRIVFIPQQHCNFENFTRDRKEITTVGIIGALSTFRYPIDEISKRLEKIGLKLITNSDFKTRIDVVNFYKKIDIQIVWDTRRRLLKNPLKIINAASFGIPTVGYPHKGYKEVEGYYIKASTIDQLIEEVEKLKDEENYKTASKNLLQMAEKYHISKIAEMYKKLI